jgi:hypothetical protein
MIAGPVMVTVVVIAVVVMVEAAGVAEVVAAVADRTSRAGTMTISRGVVSRECRVEILARRMAADVRSRMNESHVA